MVALNTSVGSKPWSPSSSQLPIPAPSRTALWQRLAVATDNLKRLFQRAIGVKSTHENVICPEHSVVKVCTVKSRMPVMTPINANRIAFSRCDLRGLELAPQLVIAGQSPQEFNLCENFLIQGIDSGQGLFQFVSRKAHKFTMNPSAKESSEKSVIDLLKSAKNGNAEVILGGRFKVMDFKQVLLPGINADNDHCCYELTVKEGKAEQKTVHLTQAGLEFSNNLLRAKEIKKADALVDAHLKFDRAPPAAEFAGQTDPMIISHAGIGRNAALIVYREMMVRVAAGLKEEDIDVALVDVVINGRKGRGPMFLHSQAQIDEVRDVLVDEIRKRDAKGSLSKSATLPGPINRSTTQPSLGAPPQRVNTALLPPPDAVGRGEQATIDEAGPSSRAQHDSRLLRQDTVRSTLANLIEAQRDKHPLQVIENLARSNRQVAALASVIAAQVEVDPDHEIQFQGEPFIRTGLAEVERQEIQTSYSEPEYRVLLAKPKSKWWSRKTAPQSLMKTKSELLADRLVDALNAHPASDTENDQQATDCCEGDAPSLHQRLMSDAPFSITDQNERAPVALTNAQRFEKTPTDVAALACSLGNIPHAEFIRQIAAKNENAATFLNFVSHSLLAKDSVTLAPLERYPYVGDEAYLKRKIRESANPFVPTFIEGVERNFNLHNANDSAWRIHNGEQWQEGQSRRDVLIHVLLQAMQHLEADGPSSAAMPVYPLVAYEVLADAIGVPVPQYLKDHETTILSTLTANQVGEDMRKNGILAQQQQDQISRNNAQASMQQRFRDSDVTNDVQWELSRSGYRRDLVDESVDAVIPLPSGPGNPAVVKEMRDRLRTTHVKQEISARNHNGHMQDNLCWLRSSWLSAFASATPDQLASRLLAISSPAAITNYAEAHAPVLQAIAQLYNEDPVAFMRGDESPFTVGQAAISRDDNLAKSAHLGASQSLASVIGDRFSSTINAASLRSSPEAFLQRLQLEIATAFRPPTDGQGKLVDTRFMSEIQGLINPGSPATSNLPVTLHRALDLPLLVVEHEGQSAQLRVTAPNNSKIANHLERLTQPHCEPQDAINTLMSSFTHLPVLWLDGNHYSVYLPKPSV